MRLRNIPGARDAIAASPWVIQKPEDHCGSWKEIFGNDRPLHLEIGTGKGRFIMQLAQEHPEINYIGIEKYSSVLLRCLEKQEELQLQNLFFIRGDATLLLDFFGPSEVDRIFINFCDPWTRQNKPKRRLTYRAFLDMYRQVLVPGGQIHFKTDNDPLFDFTLEEMQASGWETTCVTRDLHKSEWDKDNIRTEFESKYAEQGIPIKRVVGVMLEKKD